MKLQAEINDKNHNIEVKRVADTVWAEVDGRVYEIEASEPESNVYLLKHDGKIYEVFVSPHSDTGEPVNVRVGANELEITLIDPKRLRGGRGVDAHAAGAAEIKTAMPGKVVRIIAATGAEIKKGDGVIVVEAMKMQNEIRSPKDGIVKEIRVPEGSTVNAGDVLAVIE
jgi:biotin carboxyl carrier protein